MVPSITIPWPSLPRQTAGKAIATSVASIQSSTCVGCPQELFCKTESPRVISSAGGGICFWEIKWISGSLVLGLCKLCEFEICIYVVIAHVLTIFSYWLCSLQGSMPTLIPSISIWPLECWPHDPYLFIIYIYIHHNHPFGGCLQKLVTPYPNLTKVQTTAASAVNWCHQKGGHVEPDDVVGKLASLGACGKYPANVERDMQSMLSTFGKRLGVSISWIPCRICWEQKHETYGLYIIDNWTPFCFEGGVNFNKLIYKYTSC